MSTITVPFTVTFPGQNLTDAWDKCSFTLEDARDAANNYQAPNRELWTV
ncbi:MAG: hypothetical protein IPJ39_20695 [Saprospiraceae bacterium]|nr:hypothetical protein [Saprospiraceae bacterium]